MTTRILLTLAYLAACVAAVVFVHPAAGIALSVLGWCPIVLLWETPRKHQHDR